MNHENMKMTEVGWIPKDWEVKTLENIGNFSKGRGVSRDQSHSGNLPCVRYGELYTSHDNYIRNFYSFISQEVADTAKRLNKGDVLFAASGETKEEIGKAVAFVGNEEAYAGGDIIILSPKIESNSMFLGFVLNGEESVRQKSALGQGDAVVHIHAPELSKVSIPFPPISEQRRIAQVLSDTDSLIASLSRTIEKKRLVKQGAMQQLLTGKTRLKGFSGEWVEKDIKDIVVRFATGLNPRQNFVLNKEGATNYYVTIKNFKDGVLYLDDNCDKIDDEALELINHRSDLQQGDVLLSSIGRVGDACIVKHTPKNWNINESVFSLRPNKKIIDSYFFYYVLKGEEMAKQFSNSTTGSTLTSIKMSHLKELTCHIPVDLNEQFAIADILTTMDNEIASLEAELQKYKALKQGMMQKLLTGQIRLK